MLVNYPLLDVAAATTGSPLLLTPGPFGGTSGPDAPPLTPEVSQDTGVPELGVWCRLPSRHPPRGWGSQAERGCLLPLQTLQTLFSAPRLGEPGARAPLFTPETDKLRLDSPFPFLGSGKGLWVWVPAGGGGHAARV